MRMVDRIRIKRRKDGKRDRLTDDEKERFVRCRKEQDVQERRRC